MLTLWKPFNEMSRWNRDFDAFLQAPRRSATRRGFAPAVDIRESDDGVTLVADLPGVEEEGIEVQVHEGVLLLAGERAAEDDAKRDLVHRERSHGRFERRFRLGDTIDADNIEAVYENGVLTVSLPKKEQVKPRQIPVSTN